MQDAPPKIMEDSKAEPRKAQRQNTKFQPLPSPQKCTDDGTEPARPWMVGPVPQEQ